MNEKDTLFLHQSLKDFPVMLWKWDLVRNTFLSSANLATFLRTGTPSGIPTLNEFIKYTHPDDCRKIEALREDILAGRRDAFSLFYRMRDDLGTLHWVLTQGQVTARDGEGIPCEATGLTIDQTRQRKTEEFARQNRQVLMSFFDTLDDIVFICNPTGTLLSLNSPALAAEIFGDKWSEGQSLRELLRNRGASEDSLTRLFAEGPTLTSISLTDQKEDIRFLEVKTRLGMWGGESAFFGICHDFTTRKKALMELRLRREQLELALDGAEEGLWDYDLSSQEIAFDERSASILERDHEKTMPFSRCREYIHPEDLPLAKEHLQQHMEGLSPLFSVQFRIIVPPNRIKWILQRGRISRRDSEGNALQMIGTLMDVSEHKKDEEVRMTLLKKLRESEERLTLALEATQEGLWDWDLKNDTVFISDHWVEMLGYTDEDIPNSAKVLFDIMHPEDKEEARIKLRQHLKGETPFYEAEFRALTKNGEWKWITSRGKVVSRGPDGTPVRIVGTHTDISGRIQNLKKISELETRLREASSHDSLTGVLNRQAFRRILKREADRSLRYSTPLCVILINFDHFNHINSQYGHQAGDRLLIEAGQRFSQTIRTSDVLARWSGEEFIILTPGKLRSSLALAEKLRLAIEKSSFPELPEVSASFGVAAYRPGEKLEDLFQRVDIALYKSKKNRGNRVTSQE